MIVERGRRRGCRGSWRSSSGQRSRMRSRIQEPLETMVGPPGQGATDRPTGPAWRPACQSFGFSVAEVRLEPTRPGHGLGREDADVLRHRDVVDIPAVDAARAQHALDRGTRRNPLAIFIRHNRSSATAATIRPSSTIAAVEGLLSMRPSVSIRRTFRGGRRRSVQDSRNQTRTRKPCRARACSLSPVRAPRTQRRVARNRV